MVQPCVSRTVSWQAYADVKASFAAASIIGECVVFNIGGNKHRLISRIRYTSQKVFVLKVMTHREYDDDKWKGECECVELPPLPSADSAGWTSRTKEKTMTVKTNFGRRGWARTRT